MELKAGSRAERPLTVISRNLVLTSFEFSCFKSLSRVWPQESMASGERAGRQRLIWRSPQYRKSPTDDAVGSLVLLKHC